MSVLNNEPQSNIKVQCPFTLPEAGRREIGLLSLAHWGRRAKPRGSAPLISDLLPIGEGKKGTAKREGANDSFKVWRVGAGLTHNQRVNRGRVQARATDGRGLC